MQARMIEQIPILSKSGKLLGLHLMHEVLGASRRTNWAVVLAGGKGARLRPITEDIPKPMVRVAGRPILERIVLHLVGFGIRTIYLSINHLGHLIQRHFRDGSRFGCSIRYLKESFPLGTGGPLSLLPKRPSDPLVIMNGDLVTQVDLGSMLDKHTREGYRVTVGVREYVHTIPYGCVERKGDRITRLTEKPRLHQEVNAGIYIMEPALLSRVPRRREFPMTSLLEECIARGEAVGAYPVEGDWIDLGDHDQLRQANGERTP
jgi:NDP-sugar pyrophosphorylase family protein